MIITLHLIFISIQTKIDYRDEEFDDGVTKSYNDYKIQMQVSMNIGLPDDQEKDSAKALLCVAEVWFVCWSICSSRIYAGAAVLYPI
ncbi:MAG: hypothetical protein EZS28_004691 [Streblomastix strix]|uniref:Uncharacterized protein n=1 Tax=Streblomastix strix TaxID=222440 RepID=A0A5J4WY75_9EUKA|nr:MAG: hypothetical protein EZS28_004691 [Streblomastix strix]